MLPYAGKYLFPTAIIAETGTVYLTVLVTINRYLSVCRPYDPPGRRSVEAARLHVLAVAVLSVVYNVPRFFEFDVAQRQVRPPLRNKMVKVIALNGTPMTELRDVTCHMGSHSVTCYPTQVNAFRPNPSPHAGTRFTYPGGMEG